MRLANALSNILCIVSFKILCFQSVGTLLRNGLDIKVTPLFNSFEIPTYGPFVENLILLFLYVKTIFVSFTKKKKKLFLCLKTIKKSYHSCMCINNHFITDRPFYLQFSFFFFVRILFYYVTVSYFAFTQRKIKNFIFFFFSFFFLFLFVWITGVLVPRPLPPYVC